MARGKVLYMSNDGAANKIKRQDGSVSKLRNLTVDDLQIMGIPRRYWDARYDYFPSGSSQRLVLDNYLHPDKIRYNVSQGIGLMLYGANGTGKTSLTSIILKRARRYGFDCFFGSAFDLFEAFANKVPFDEGVSLWDWCKQVDLLVIDDLGHEGESWNHKESRLFEVLLRHRTDDLKSTIVTTNLYPDEFEKQYKNGKSICSVMKDSIVPFEILSDDIRSDNAQGLVDKILD